MGGTGRGKYDRIREGKIDKIVERYKVGVYIELISLQVDWLTG